MQETLYSTLRIGHQDRVITLQLFDKRTIDACVFWWESGKIFAKSQRATDTGDRTAVGVVAVASVVCCWCCCFYGWCCCDTGCVKTML